MQEEPSTSAVLYDPLFDDGARLAVAGFLAGYRGATRDAYALGWVGSLRRRSALANPATTDPSRVRWGTGSW